MNRLTLSIGGLFLLVIATNLPDWLAEEDMIPQTETETAWQPNYQASEMLSTLFDKDGRLSHQVFASKMEHFEMLGFTLFKQPQYTIFVESQASPWQVSAKDGTLYEDNRIQLENNVEIRNQDEQGFASTIRTDFIEINLIDKTMESDQPVQIFGQHYVINSNGLKANLSTQQYELLDHVQTIYQPRP
ncbi:LPS export ABC transporter periplasmic protein LptC [Paraglaciecola sp. L1A13]|uniref:LPS export ABC transporter periplasmic protein LptC n=1 Tax=Paraglaciecola sp. L1A13 TaxID=2686359 RepID=UPI00131B6FB8|nr:LPS export ABC transporter periplasmic protein LptC [Paraglaciecola sp. L1A13]|tara:strand:+ start:18320 stop:18883 length:564 start_codon:yes stop_codon:yes gene_type:complete